MLCVIQEGFLAKEAIELPSENRQGSGLGEGIGLRAWRRGNRRKRPKVYTVFSPSGCLSFIYQSALWDWRFHSLLVLGTHGRLAVDPKLEARAAQLVMLSDDLATRSHILLTF